MTIEEIVNSLNAEQVRCKEYVLEFTQDCNNNKKTTNCVNCGAGLSSNVCEYCKTRY